MKIKHVFTDMDGTLLASNGRVTTTNASLISKSNLPLTLVSARAPLEMREAVTVLNLTGPQIASVYVDRTQSYQALFSYLKKQNIHHLALLFSCNTPASPTFSQTMKFFLDSMSEVKYQTFGNISSPEDGLKLIPQLKSKKFDAVLANRDDLALVLEQNLPADFIVVSQERQISGQLNQIIGVDGIVTLIPKVILGSFPFHF